MAHSSSPMTADAEDAAGAAAAGFPSVGRIELEALEWQVALWSGEDTPEERQAFQKWLAADAVHRAAWRRVQAMGQRIHAAPDEVAGKALRAGLSGVASRRRRGVLGGLFLLAGCSATAYVAKQGGYWPALGADYSTLRGERRDLTLPDGTRLSLNTASAVELRFNDRERRISLLAGEVLIATAADGAPVHRPFIVQTSEGSVRALGTRFLVRRLEGASPAQVSVQVFEGAVEVTPESGAAALRVDAGRQTRFTRRAAQAPFGAEPQAASWQRGFLVAERLRLDDFLAELGRYRHGILRCDPAVSGLAVSGVYPLEDTDVVLDSLQQALPVRVHRRTRYWVTVAAP